MPRRRSPARLPIPARPQLSAATAAKTPISTAPCPDSLLDLFWFNWHARLIGKVRFSKGETESSIGALADRMLKAFLSSELAQPRGTIIGIEEELRGIIVPGLPELVGRVDLMVDAGSELVVTDFKTSRCRWDGDRVNSSADQLLLYSDLIAPLADGKPLRLDFAVLTKTKVPAVTRHPLPFNKRQVERTRRIVERVWHAIEGRHFYPHPSAQCATCPFRAPCARWRG